jgi:hypothetical protein
MIPNNIENQPAYLLGEHLFSTIEANMEPADLPMAHVTYP